MTGPTPPGSRVAGMWRLLKEHEWSRDNYGVAISLVHDYSVMVKELEVHSGNVYWLDESPEAIAEARQEKLVYNLETACGSYKMEIDRLTADNASLSRKLHLLEKVVSGIDPDEGDEIASLTAKLAAVERERDFYLDQASEWMPGDFSASQASARLKTRWNEIISLRTGDTK
jgi:hypothetical protein